MFDLNAIAAVEWPIILAATSIARLWYAVPLVTSVSLVCAATRHEQMGPILMHALRFGIWVIVFMGIILCVLQFLSWLQ
jgi:hypothetical protein